MKQIDLCAAFLESDLERTSDLVAFCHLPWHPTYQRPQHLLSRFARYRRVFYVEDPVFGAFSSPRLQVNELTDGPIVVSPQLPQGLEFLTLAEIQRSLIGDLFDEYGIERGTHWYDTPTAFAFTDHLQPEVLIYDCANGSSALKSAKGLEDGLLHRADVVLTSGRSLYETKRQAHANVHLFPNGIDADHFRQARAVQDEPQDQCRIPHPRLGFFGIIDERVDFDLIQDIAEAKPNWHIVLVGPIVKVDPDTLPRLPNIHYLGKKDYHELPYYLAGWNATLLPFTLEGCTRFISPTKALECLAAGKPVVSTPIHDIIRPYGEMGLVEIAEESPAFVSAIEKALDHRPGEAWLKTVDELLAGLSWDTAWRQIAELEKSHVRKTTPWGSFRNKVSETRTPAKSILLA